jgi:hypothetical protein
MPPVERDVTFDAGAGAYDRFTGRWSVAFRSSVLATAGVSEGQTVLEVSAGARAAGGWSASRRVIVTYLASHVAGREGQARDLPVHMIAMDGQTWRAAIERDAVIASWPQPLPDLGRGLREFRRVPPAQAAAAGMVGAGADQFLGMLADALNRHFPAQREAIYSPTSLGDPARLDRLLRDAGFQDVSVVAETREIAFASFDEYWGGVEAGAGKLGQFYLELPQDARRAVRDEGWQDAWRASNRRAA